MTDTQAIALRRAGTASSGRRRCVLVLIAVLMGAASGYQEANPILYCQQYNPKKTRIANPRTPQSSLFPPKLRWSAGGDTHAGIQLLIACDRRCRTYHVNDLIGIRTGVRNCSKDTVRLDHANYVPNGGRRPVYYLYMLCPDDAEAAHFGYMGDDVRGIDFDLRRRQGLPKVPPGAVFNPSGDGYYYNGKNDVLRITTPGIFRLWANIHYDSTTTSLSMAQGITYQSDTLVLKILPLSPLHFCLGWLGF